jgi:hypothetical protein
LFNTPRAMRLHSFLGCPGYGPDPAIQPDPAAGLNPPIGIRLPPEPFSHPYAWVLLHPPTSSEGWTITLVIRRRFFFGHCAGIQHSYVLKLSSGCLETLHPLFEFASLLRPVLSHAPDRTRAGYFGPVEFRAQKNRRQEDPSRRHRY